MQVTAVEDVAAPIDHVFSELTNFTALERQALRRGMDVRRSYRSAMPEIGEGWTVKFRFRGKDREATILLQRFEDPQALEFGGVSGGLETQTQIDLVPLSPNRTRVNVVVKLTPKTLSARLLVQSFKLARSNINKRFKSRMASYARDIEDRLSKTA